MFRVRPVVAAFVFLAAPGMVHAQGQPLGPEFRVNSFTTSGQLLPAAASDAAGNFVVAWQSNNQDAGGYGIFAQRFAVNGAPLGGEFRVNSFSLGDQERPSVASDAAGNFVIVWRSEDQDGDGAGVFGQRYDSAGAPLGAEFQVNTYTTGLQIAPSTACDPAGNFVVTWTSGGQDGSGAGIFAQRYDSGGVPLGNEFRVNSYTENAQGAPSVDFDSAGNFIVAWHSYPQDGNSSGVFAQRFASTGAPLGGEFRANTYTTNTQAAPAVASDAGGNFVVAWASITQDGAGTGIFAQRFGSNGVPLGGEFRVNTFTPGIQSMPAVTSDSAGNFVVTWHSFSQDGSGYGVYAQRYASTGAALGGEFRVNTHTTSEQQGATVAVDQAGNFVIAWWSIGQDGNYAGVFAQRYSMILPVELQSFRVE